MPPHGLGKGPRVRARPLRHGGSRDVACARQHPPRRLRKITGACGRAHERVRVRSCASSASPSSPQRRRSYGHRPRRRLDGRCGQVRIEGPQLPASPGSSLKGRATDVYRRRLRHRRRRLRRRVAVLPRGSISRAAPRRLRPSGRRRVFRDEGNAVVRRRIEPVRLFC